MTPEYSYTVDLEAVRGKTRRVALAPDESERAAIADRLGVIAVEALRAELTIAARARDFSVEGELEARLRRECVASLEPMTENVADRFALDFTREASSTETAPETAQDQPDDLDAPEYHEGALFDLGELLVQQLSLAMAAYPRKEGASELVAEYGAAAESSPFAEILKLNRDKQS